MERLSIFDLASDPVQRAIHTYRYEFAAQFATDADRVVDAACGIGYGREYFGGEWFGFDKEPPAAEGNAYAVDLNIWHPLFPFDVFVGLETIEHLDDYTNYVAAAKLAGRCIVISTPIIPTVHFNPYHLHDFTPESLSALFVDDEWQVEHYETQVDPVLGIETYGLWAFVRCG